MPHAIGMLLALVGAWGTCALSAQAQEQLPKWMWPEVKRAVEPRIIAGGGLNFQGPRVASSTLAGAQGVPWIGFELGTGASFTVHDRWGFDVQGSFAYQSTMLYVDSVCFPVFLPNARLELRLWRLLPWPNWEEWELKPALAAGWSFQDSGGKSRSDDAFHTVTRYDAMTRPYIAAEVGIWRWDYCDRYEFALRYVHHVDPAPAFASTITGPTGTATFTGTQDHLALVFRRHFALPKRTPAGPWPTTAYDTRATDTLVALATRRSGVPLVLWDDAEHDGDTISVLLNGEVVLDHFELTPAHHRLYLRLNWGDNTVLIVAHNEGRVPPNTARAFIRTGHGRCQLLVKTSPTRSAAVKVQYH